MPSETRRKPIHGGSDTASLRCRVSEGTALTPFTLRKTKHYGRGEHAVNPSQLLSKSSDTASLRCRVSEGTTLTSFARHSRKSGGGDAE